MENKLIYTAPEAEVEVITSEDVVLISVVNETGKLPTQKFEW